MYLQVPVDLFTFTQKLLTENITFLAVPVSTKLHCV